MKRFVLLLPFLVMACTDAKQTLHNASTYMQDECQARPTFAEVFACTKNRLYNDPVAASIAPNPAENAEVSAYGEQISSQLRQHLITDAQARQAFAQKLAEVRARYAAQPMPVAPR